ncbi:MAG: hypothetical protein ABSG98_01440 [Anaerolineales bacterium]
MNHWLMQLAGRPLRTSGMLVLALGLVSCGYSPKSPNSLLAAQNGSSGDTASPLADEATVLQVFLPGGGSIPFTLRQLRVLPQATLDVPGGQLSGPPLEEILQATGVGDYRTVTLVGKESVRLSSLDVSPQVILRLTSQGTLDLAGANIPHADWVRDVHEIYVH